VRTLSGVFENVRPDPMLDHVWEGYDCTLMAYGQTIILNIMTQQFNHHTYMKYFTIVNTNGRKPQSCPGVQFEDIAMKMF